MKRSPNTVTALTDLLSPKRALIVWALVTCTLASSLLVLKVVIALPPGESIQLKVGNVEFTSNMLGSRSTSLTVVHPNGWNDTKIAVLKGQRISIVTGGSVNVDVVGTVRAGELRRAIEARFSDPRSTVSAVMSGLPEDALSAADLALLTDATEFRPWNGPNGQQPQTSLSRARASRRALPNAALGALIGQVRFGGSQDQSTPPFMVGEHLADFEVPASGTLWLAVNDVVFPAHPNLFWADNVGFFVAVVGVH